MKVTGRYLRVPERVSIPSLTKGKKPTAKDRAWGVEMSGSGSRTVLDNGFSACQWIRWPFDSQSEGHALAFPFNLNDLINHRVPGGKRVTKIW